MYCGVGEQELIFSVASIIVEDSLEPRGHGVGEGLAELQSDVLPPDLLDLLPELSQVLAML